MSNNYFEKIFINYSKGTCQLCGKISEGQVWSNLVKDTWLAPCFEYCAEHGHNSSMVKAKVGLWIPFYNTWAGRMFRVKLLKNGIVKDLTIAFNDDFHIDIEKGNEAFFSTVNRNNSDMLIYKPVQDLSDNIIYVDIVSYEAKKEI